MSGPQIPPGSFVLYAWVTPDGKAYVHGPLQNKAMCQRLLDEAKVIVEKAKGPEPAKPTIVAPPPGFNPHHFHQNGTRTLHN